MEVQTVMTKNDAALLLTFILTIALPFIIAWLSSKNLHWSGFTKFLVTAACSCVIGALRTFIDDGLNSSASLLQNAINIFIAAQAIYQTWFKALGFEQYLYPQQGVISSAQETVKQEIAKLPEATIKDIVNPKTDTTLVVSTNITNNPPEVQPARSTTR